MHSAVAELEVEVSYNTSSIMVSHKTLAHREEKRLLSESLVVLKCATVINRSFGQFFMLSGIVHGIRPVLTIGPFRAFSKCDTYHIHFQSPLSVENWWGSTAINAESVISPSWVLRTARVEWKVALLGQILPISGN